MKKKNTKSCFTWLKNIFVSHPINKASLCLTLSMVSLVSVGFSSWMLVGGATELGPIDVTVGNIQNGQEDLKGSAYFVKGSEKGFDTYSFDNSIGYSKTDFSCQLKIRPDLMNGLFGNSEKEVQIGLTYNYRTSFDKNLFANADIQIPDSICFSISNSSNRKLYSVRKEITSQQEANASTTHFLRYFTYLYSLDEPSLCDIASDFQKNNEYVYIDITIPFLIKEGMENMFKDVTFNFITNMMEE